MADLIPEVGRKITFLGIKSLERLGNLGLACMPQGTEGRVIAVGKNGAIGALLMAERSLFLRVGLMPEEYRVEPDDPWAPVPFTELRGGDAFLTTTGRKFVKLDREVFQCFGGSPIERNAIDITTGACVTMKKDLSVFYMEARMVVERIGGKIEDG